MKRELAPGAVERILVMARAGQPPDALLQPLLDDGWEQGEATAAVESVVRDWLDSHARDSGLPPSVPVPSPIDLNGSSILQVGDRGVSVLASMLLPRVIVFGG